MPLVDMSLDELKHYRGRTQRPEDFDAFWERAKGRLAAVDPQLILETASFKAPGVACYDLWFNGLGGARIHAKYLRPQGRDNCPALLEFHGYTSDSGDWSDKLPYVMAGFCVAALDCRGQGGLSEDTGGTKGSTMGGHILRGLLEEPEKLLFSKIYLDTVRLAQLIADFPEVDHTRIATIGGSQGGALALACAALAPQVSRVVAQYPFLSDFRRVWEMDLATDAYEDLRLWFRLYDPLHKREEEVFERLSYIDLVHLAPLIHAETLMATGLMDTICPPSTQFAVYNNLPGPKQMLLYPDFGHESMPGFSDAAFQFFHDWFSGASK
ncbi:MAG: alpha/beta fold hydrolase [Eubacteriales bacterium]|nr:alpha/beta fold hydrolase [Eubacteriales bacterium]